jgi:hypothetical protein
MNWCVSTCIVTEEFAHVIEKQRFSGIAFRPVRLFKNISCKDPLDGYLEMRVIGRVPADMENSGISVEYQCNVCGAVVYSSWRTDSGIRFQGDPREWPDAFRITQMPSLNFVTARFAQFLIDSSVDSVSLTDASLVLPAWAG